ncbi:MAG: malto-oligosyltrehalose trehalohydrolase [Deltaproteobacteria bacterium]|nr:malto-oligosyltrehalose trehalohydrolase [Deltaproteobacteria bacterium]
MTWQLQRGATFYPNGSVRFCVWAPRVGKMAVRVVSADDQTVAMARNSAGVHTVTVQGVRPGSRYFYLLDGERTRPDPVSRFQPEGVHGPSAVVDPSAFSWTDQAWHGRASKDLILYELHPGTFTAEGTFAAILPYLDYLKYDLGITAVELMPIAEFPGQRNWGYDGTHPYAPHSAYGGPQGLKTLINACHDKQLAVVLDVVYNHLGPEGNYLSEYGPYFTDSYHTPWGQGVNFAGAGSTEVRRYFLDNALYWITEYHVDALRLDAIHGIVDASPTHILQELGEAVHAQARALDRTAVVIAESDLNESRVITPVKEGGWGLDAQWNDDFHHSLHTLLTGEQRGYYQDFGRLADLAVALSEGFVYQGQHSLFRQRPHGTSSRAFPGERFVICSQNHDQIGNRAQGDRLSTLVPFPALKLAAGLVLCAPNVPLLFMGEEYGETAPFLYFTSHTDPQLVQAVQAGRQREFAGFAWGEKVPDPQDPETFRRSILHHHLREQQPYQALLHFYRDLIVLRQHSPTLRNCNKECMNIRLLPEQNILLLHRWQPQEDEVLVLTSFAATAVSLIPPLPPGQWQRVLDAEEECYSGSALAGLPAVLRQDQPRRIVFAPFAFALYRNCL